MAAGRLDYKHAAGNEQNALIMLATQDDKMGIQTERLR
jgi:hypothetical protein